MDLRNAFKNKNFSHTLRRFEIHNHKKPKIIGGTTFSFDPKEVEMLGGQMMFLEEFAISGCKIDDPTLRIFFSGFKRLKSLNLENCKGYSNQIFLFICILLKEIKVLKLGGGELEYNRTITYEGLEVFKEYPIKLQKLSLNYCAKVGKKCIDAIAACWK